MLPAFGWRAVLTHWEFAPDVTAVAVAVAVAYLWGTWRVARRHPARPWPWWRTALFLCGVAVVVLAIESGIGTYDDVLAWDHMVQHLLLLMVAPPLLVAGQPVTLLLHASRNPLHTWVKRAIRSRVVTFLTWPPFGLVAYSATIVGTHLTVLSRIILQNQSVHYAEHALYLIVGYLFFLPTGPGPSCGSAGMPSCSRSSCSRSGCGPGTTVLPSGAGWRRRAGPGSRSWSRARPGRRPRCRIPSASEERPGNRGRRQGRQRPAQGRR